MLFSRRHFLQLSAASSLLLPRQGLAATGERKFLFLFCPGGWDQCAFTAPLFDSSYVDMIQEGAAATINGIQIVDSSLHPALRSFLEHHGGSCALINGIEARSVAHDVCLRLICTGASDTHHDDWPSIIAAHSAQAPLLPQIHLSGPSYTQDYSSEVVRIGNDAQLLELLNMAPFSTNLDQLSDQLLLNALPQQNHPLAARSAALLQNIQNLDASLLAQSQDLGASLQLVENIFAQDLSRSIMLSYNGVRDLGWDTHAGNHMQHWHLEELFTELKTFLTSLKTRAALSGGSLIDEVTVVVMSEMGRFPRFNFREGRDHWTFTSSWLMGAGVAGGQTIGGWDEYGLGQPVNLQSGTISTEGSYLGPNELGATLLRLADIDHTRYLDAELIAAAIDD
jgi:uncharacterized protein (DUF1501 family)